jgi:two-component sensor histidine kinase
VCPAQAIAVALHELATNAAKYGALSVTTGQVRVEWSRAADGQLALRWTETGGPTINPPTRRGWAGLLAVPGGFLEHEGRYRLYKPLRKLAQKTFG